VLYNDVVTFVGGVAMEEKIPSVDEIAKIIMDAIDDLTAKTISKDNAVVIIREIVSIKAKRLKILDGDKVKSRFESKMGKGRLEKFYPLLIEAEEQSKKLI